MQTSQGEPDFVLFQQSGDRYDHVPQNIAGELGTDLIYRMRIYRAVPENLSLFNEFFHQRLLPVQQRLGARLVGRWQTDDDRIVAVWEYDSVEAFEKIQVSVREDSESIDAQKYRRENLPELVYEMEEVFMTSTVSA